MNAKSGLKGIVLAALVLVAGIAFGASKGSLELQHPTSVAGKKLSSGNYSLRWDGTGDQVQVKIYQGKNEVVSAPAKVVKMDHRPTADSALVNTNADGSYSLSQIRFGGKDYALEIVNDGGGTSGAGASR